MDRTRDGFMIRAAIMESLTVSQLNTCTPVSEIRLALRAQYSAAHDEVRAVLIMRKWQTDSVGHLKNSW